MNLCEKGEVMDSLDENLYLASSQEQNHKIHSGVKSDKNELKQFSSCDGHGSQEENNEVSSECGKHFDPCECEHEKCSGMNSRKSSSRYVSHHNNNVLIEKSNLGCSDDKNCCYYMKFPYKVNNNVYSENDLTVSDGMEEYFRQLSASSSSKQLSSNDTQINSCSNCLDSKGIQDGSFTSGRNYFPDLTNALNGDEVDEDESCIYTYKGDTYDPNFTNLMQTCFSCGLPTLEIEYNDRKKDALSSERSLNGATQNHRGLSQNNLYSPDMDFLEMDFDPESNGDDGDSDCEDNNGPGPNNSEIDPIVMGCQSSEGNSKTNNISGDIQSLLCRRCQMSVFADQKVTNTNQMSPKPNIVSNLKNTVDFTLDDRPNIIEISSNSVSDLNMPSTSQKHMLDVSNDSNSDKVENNFDFIEAFETETSDGDDADDERDDSVADHSFHSTAFRDSSGSNTKGNIARPDTLNSFDILKFKDQITKGVDHNDLSCISDKGTHRENNNDNTSKTSLKIALKNGAFSSRAIEDNNLGSVSAPEVSPSKEYSPLENFSRSVSFHNQLSSPKYENVCFTHSCKNNILSTSVGSLYKDNNTHNCCKVHSNSEVASNLEACADRLSQREKSVFNITSPGEQKRKPYAMNGPSGNASNLSVYHDVSSHLIFEASDVLDPLPLKVLQPKISDPFRDPNTVSEIDLESESPGASSCPEKVMVWTERQATSRQVPQIGTSACGPTAIINILLALGFAECSKEVTSVIETRLRAENASLVPYLLSRGVAGTTHRDLIKGAEEVSKGAVRGRFFHMYPKRAVQLSRWLAGWISKGAVPVATLNLQVGVCPGQTIPDAWHHQMVFGVGPQGVYMTNPLECVSDSHLADQLCSDSVLLVRRSDVTSRWDHSDQLIQLSLQTDLRWNDMNVLGQVVSVLKEDASPDPEAPQGRKHLTSHVSIPASYYSGISIFARSDNSACLNDLLEAAELPLLDEE